MPWWMGTQHLTLLTLLWSGLILLFSYLVRTNPRYLLALCAVIFVYQTQRRLWSLDATARTAPH
jgi:hypothetical protein